MLLVSEWVGRGSRLAAVPAARLKLLGYVYGGPALLARRWSREPWAYMWARVRVHAYGLGSVRCLAGRLKWQKWLMWESSIGKAHWLLRQVPTPISGTTTPNCLGELRETEKFMD
ncbi:hypothetical protein FNV43_RR26649 [Rhamnella rubrinervis]|uniref:Uncharacterized protein n=1 Tax=Rhamnella rubrinervis TaxID=2594499 RepID=A0A8K0DPP7_9ROSA|nr:hypothetical protein FNV43_RR26649 [Rhamnella rubrinervis]